MAVRKHNPIEANLEPTDGSDGDVAGHSASIAMGMHELATGGTDKTRTAKVEAAELAPLTKHWPSLRDQKKHR